jgi:hypothetical protein
MKKLIGGLATIALSLLVACEPAARPLSTSLQIGMLPPVWPQAHPITCACGAYQAQAVLRAHGKDIAISKLYTSEWARTGCHTMPWDIPFILAQIGHLKTEAYYYFSDLEFEQIAKRSLEHQHPVIVLIQATRGHYGLHWVSLWGYSASTKTFLVYDSQYPSKVGGVGNTQYSVSYIESRFPWWTTAAVEVDG